jgi:hypothetical protein
MLYKGLMLAAISYKHRAYAPSAKCACPEGAVDFNQFLLFGRETKYFISITHSSTPLILITDVTHLLIYSLVFT